MKLGGLTATVTGPNFKRMLVGLSPDTFDQLALYRQSREAGGFVRLATELLLALTEDAGSAKGTIEQLADKLTVHCDNIDDLDGLITNCDELARQLNERYHKVCADAESR